MKTIRFILLLCILLSTKVFAQRQGSACELDSIRRMVLAPKLEQYDRQVEKFTSLISATTDKRRIKQYARQIAQVSDAMEDEIATLYDYNGAARGSIYVGGGMGPWGFYPGVGGMWYPGGYGYYSYLPPIYYDVDRIKHYANNMRFITSHANVSKKLEFIHKKVETLKTACVQGAC